MNPNRCRPRTRNRESKNAPPVQRCHHVWAHGFCLKCGAMFSDIAEKPQKKNSNGGVCNQK